MKRSPYVYLLPVAIVFLVLAVLLYFIHPLAPLLLLASLLIQLPLVWALTRHSYNKGYAARAEGRWERFQEDGDAAAWLAMEEKEVESFGYRFFSSGSRALNLLNRAQMLSSLNRAEEAAALLVNIQPGRLSKEEAARYSTLAGQLEAVGKEGGAREATPERSN